MLSFLSSTKHFLVVAVALALGACGVQQTQSSTSASKAADVELLEAKEAVNSGDFVFSAGSTLKDIKGIRDQIYDQINAAFIGFTISSTKNDKGEFQFTGPLKAFSGRYIKHKDSISSPWPRTEFKDEHWQDIRDGVLATKLLFPEDTNNLRIYSYPARVGYKDAKYTTEMSLLITHIDPASGERSTFIFKTDHKLYKVDGLSFPKSLEEVSLVSNLDAGELVKADVTDTAGRVQRNKLIPAKLFSEKSYAPKFADSASGFGEPIEKDVSALIRILDAAIAGDAPQVADFKSGTEIFCK